MVLRKPIPVLVLVAVSVLAVVGASFYYVSRNGPPGSDHSQCSDPDSISSHVYNPYRLTIVKSCITASGVVDNVLQEADGDYHVLPSSPWRLRLDTLAQIAVEAIYGFFSVCSVVAHVARR